MILRPITTKHLPEHAERLRRAVDELDDGKRSVDVLYLLLFAIQQADAIDAAFRRPRVALVAPRDTPPSAA